MPCKADGATVKVKIDVTSKEGRFTYKTNPIVKGNFVVNNTMEFSVWKLPSLESFKKINE